MNITIRTIFAICSPIRTRRSLSSTSLDPALLAISRKKMLNWVDLSIPEQRIEDIDEEDFDYDLITCVDTNPFLDYQTPLPSNDLGRHAQFFGDYAIFDPSMNQFEYVSRDEQSNIMYNCNFDDTSMQPPILGYQQPMTFDGEETSKIAHRNLVHREESIDRFDIDNVDFDDDWELQEDIQKLIDEKLAAHRKSISGGAR